MTLKKINQWLDRKHIVAKPGFSRWLVPPAALAIHLCIGMAYGFSVFWMPLTQLVGGGVSRFCGSEVSLWTELFVTTCDWRISSLSWMYSLFFVFLGLSAFLWGSWVEKAGPRKSGLIAAVCWCGGLVIVALGIQFHQLWMLWLGGGVIGGIGLGLGYITPVSTLIKWFPDRRGMATGLAIMGFGGGAMIGAPMAVKLMIFFRTSLDSGVFEAILTMAAIYFVFMVGGALFIRVPRPGWEPKGWVHPAHDPYYNEHNVHVHVAWKTRQFWLVWWVLCLNVTAGIGILGMASPMLQEIFGGKLIGLNLEFNALSADQRNSIAIVAAGFTGLLSFFNIAGRFFWATLSDKIGRKVTYAIFFVLGIPLYFGLVQMAGAGSLVLFVLFVCIIRSMYGGSFATAPAYLADMFGVKHVGAIHGRLMTAWSAAGLFGPILVTQLREYHLNSGLPRAEAYNMVLYILAGLLFIGFICNWLIRPVEDHLHLHKTHAHDKELMQDHHEHRKGKGDPEHHHKYHAPKKLIAALVVSWAAVGVPIIWGFWQTIEKGAVFFKLAI